MKCRYFVNIGISKWRRYMNISAIKHILRIICYTSYKCKCIEKRIQKLSISPNTFGSIFEVPMYRIYMQHTCTFNVRNCKIAHQFDEIEVESSGVKTVYRNIETIHNAYILETYSLIQHQVFLPSKIAHKEAMYLSITAHTTSSSMIWYGGCDWYGMNPAREGCRNTVKWTLNCATCLLRHLFFARRLSLFSIFVFTSKSCSFSHSMCTSISLFLLVLEPLTLLLLTPVCTAC